MATTALVTGASGFIGRHLCARLEAAGVDVHALSRREHGEPGPVCWHRCDLADAEAVQESVAAIAPDTVFHLAGHVSGTPKLELVEPTLGSNLLGTINVLTAVQRVGCRRLVATGTMMEPRGDEPANSPYAASKWAASGYARMFYALYGTPVAILRVFMVYGPDQPDLRKLIPHTIVSLLRGEAPEISGGRWEVDWVFVEDVVEALLAAAARDEAVGQTVDVASGEVASLREVVERIAELVESDAEPAFGAAEDRPLERPIAANLEHTRAVLGWTPPTTLDEGLRRTVDWYRRRLEAGTL